MTLASSLYDKNERILIMTNGSLSTYIFEELDALDSDGCTEYSLVYMDFSILFNKIELPYRLIYIEFLLYLRYLGEIPDDVLDMMDDYYKDQSLHLDNKMVKIKKTINDIKRDYDLLYNYIHKLDDTLFFVGWLNPNIRSTGITAVFFVQEDE